MDWRAGSDFQAFTAQINVSHENNEVTLAVTFDNAAWQTPHSVVSLISHQLYLQVRVDVARISIRRRWIRLLLLRQDGLYRPVELVFVHNHTRVQFLLLQTHVVGQTTLRCALRAAHCAPDSAAPRPARKAAPRGAADTASPEPLQQFSSEGHFNVLVSGVPRLWRQLTSTFSHVMKLNEHIGACGAFSSSYKWNWAFKSG